MVMSCNADVPDVLKECTLFFVLTEKQKVGRSPRGHRVEERAYGTGRLLWSPFRGDGHTLKSLLSHRSGGEPKWKTCAVTPELSVWRVEEGLVSHRTKRGPSPGRGEDAWRGGL